MTVNHIVLFEPQIPANTGNYRKEPGAATKFAIAPDWTAWILDRWQALKTRGAWLLHDVDITYHKSLKRSWIFRRTTIIFNYKIRQPYVWWGGFSPRWGAILHVRERNNRPSWRVYAWKRREMLATSDEHTHVRSLNLSNTAAIVVYEALRQQRFAGLELVHTYDHDKLK